MSTSAIKSSHRYSYGDYINWPEDERWEIVNGVPYNMSPGPSRKHQELLGVLFNRIFNYLEGKTCRVYAAPFDVRLPVATEKDEDIETVVQPDILVVCDRSKLDDKGCKGAPDLIVEIVSPSSGVMDRKIKRELYEKAGVMEYWVVDETSGTVEVYKINPGGQYGKSEVYGNEDKIKVGIFEELEINLKDIFREEY